MIKMKQVNQFLLWQCVKFMICQKANIKMRKLFIYVYSHVHYYMCCKLKTINAMVSFFSHSVNLWPWVLCVYSHLSGSKCLKMSNDVLSIKSFWTTIYIKIGLPSVQANLMFFFSPKPIIGPHSNCQQLADRQAFVLGTGGGGGGATKWGP